MATVTYVHPAVHGAGDGRPAETEQVVAGGMRDRELRAAGHEPHDPQEVDA